MGFVSAALLVGFICFVALGTQFILVLAQCQEKNGRFANPTQCDAYIECIDGVPEEKLCPDGLVFNEKARFNTYPCQYPVDVDCNGRSLQPAQATGDCPHQFGYFRLGSATDCGRFMNCVNGRGYEFFCPDGLAYNEQTLRCDWPDQVPSCDAESYLGFRCPDEAGPYTIGSGIYPAFGNPQNCQKYFICVDGRPRLLSCEYGRAWNQLISDCDAIENVTQCAGLEDLKKSQPIKLQRG